MRPLIGAAHPTAMAMVRWASKSNGDSLMGLASIPSTGASSRMDTITCNNSNLTWTHRFNESRTLRPRRRRITFSRRTPLSRDCDNGPPHSWFQGVGPGAPIPGNAPAFGIVNYTEWKFSKKDFLSVRPIDYIVDFKGERPGFATTMASWTVLRDHRFNEVVSVRQRCDTIRFQSRPGNGTRKGS